MKPKRIEVGQQHPPVRAEPLQQPAPVQPVAVGQDDVGHVGAVVALALHDEGLGPEALLGGRDSTVRPSTFCSVACSNQWSSTTATPLPGAEDHVDEAVGRADLGQPVREHQLGLVARRGADLEQPVHVARPDEDVEILGGPVDARLVHERERAADQERHLRPGEHLHRLAVERPGRGVDQRLRGREGHRVASCRNPSYPAPAGRLWRGSPLRRPVRP